MLDPFESRRLAMLRFPLIVGVVYIHAYDVHVTGQPTPWLDFVRNLISQDLARVSVPAFFLMSGYLFFLGGRLTKARYATKLRTRVHTLLVPLVLWGLIALAVFALAQALPATRVYFSGNNAAIANYGAFDYVAAIFGIGRPPIAYQLWFLRDLIVLALFTPLIELLLRLAPRVFLALVAAAWFADHWPNAVPSVEATLYFSLGAWLGREGRSLFRFDRQGPWLVALYMILVVCDALVRAWSGDGYLHRLCIAVGVLSALYLTRLVKARGGDLLVALATSSFFVYAAHEPLLTIVRKLAIHAVHPTQASAVALYLVLPVLLIAGLVVLHRVLARRLPALTRILCGSRD